MNRTFIMTAAAVLLAATVFGQGRAAREQTVLNVFGRLNLTENPYRDLNVWTDGTNFYRPFFADLSNIANEPRMNGDTIFFLGSNTHEAGWTIDVLLDAEGKMTVANSKSGVTKGDRVERRVIGNETLLLISDARTGGLRDVLKKFEGSMEDRYIDDIYRYMLAGKFIRKDGSGGTIAFDHAKSAVTGLMPQGETAYTFFYEFGDTPIPTLVFENNIIYRVTKLLDGIELTPMKPHEEDAEFLQEDNAKPSVTLVKTAEGEQGMPPGRFPLASVQVMTLNELNRYAGMNIYTGKQDPQLLKIMRNEIFARHGYKFKTKDMTDYFGAQEWYRPQHDDVASRLSETEQINIALIQILESR